MPKGREIQSITPVLTVKSAIIIKTNSDGIKVFRQMDSPLLTEAEIGWAKTNKRTSPAVNKMENRFFVKNLIEIIISLQIMYMQQSFTIYMEKDEFNREVSGMSRKKGFHLLEKLGKELDFTPDLLLRGISVELFCGKQAVVEGIKNIIEYDENILRVNDGKNEVRILGSNLSLLCMTRDSVIIEGDIASAEYGGRSVKSE